MLICWYKGGGVMGRKQNNIVLTQEHKDLMQQNYKLVQSICSRMLGTINLTYDEMYDACIDALIYVSQIFDASKGFKFSTIMFIIARHKINNAVRQKYAQKRKINSLALSIDKLILSENDSDNFYNLLAVEDNYNFINKQTINMAFTADLTDKEKLCIVGKFYYGLEPEELRILAGYKNKQQVNKKQRNGFAKMRKVLEENGYV